MGTPLLLWMLLLLSPSITRCLRVELVPLDSSLPRQEQLRRSISRSNLRAKSMTYRVQNKAATAGGKLSLIDYSGGYLMHFKVGTPPQSFYSLIDTGSDLNWVKCSAASYPFFNVSSSSSAQTLACSSSFCQGLDSYQCTAEHSCLYEYDYALGSTIGQLFMDTVTLSSMNQDDVPSKAEFPGVVLGCAMYMQQVAVDGIVGLGRGPLSLSTQLGSGTNNKFSYCLVPPGQGLNSSLFFGDEADLRNTRGVQYIPFATQNRSGSFYFLELTGISVAGTRLNVTAEMLESGGGTVIDSGTTLSYFPDSVYSQIRAAFSASVPYYSFSDGYYGLDLCYFVPSIFSFPSMELHFADARMTLPQANFLITSGTGYRCLAMAGYPGVSIIGNIMQQNYQILYDRGRSRLSFAPTNCFAF